MAHEDEDRTSWDKAWASMPHRRLKGPAKIDVDDSLRSGFGEPVSTTISQDPPQYSEQNWRKDETCPVCGATADGTKRVLASLHPTFANGFSYRFGVWVHEYCFESWSDAGETTPIPW